VSEPSKFSDEEIEKQRRAATSRKKNVDEQRLQLIRDTQKIIRSGTLEQLEEKLELIGKGRNTPEGRALIQRFISLRGGSRR
jgi:hypothetical protein